MMDRRAFIRTGLTATAAVALGAGGCARERTGAGGMGSFDGKVMTVSGAINPDALGFTLPHEHVLVDFIGAEEASPDRYDAEEALRAILPHLEQVRALGCEAFVECTPAYIGRDPELLKRLALASGLMMLTNTGYYGAANDKFVPGHAYEETVDQLADRWTAEWEAGIEDTGILPGFIKSGVDSGPLSEIDAKLVRAAARTHLRTGLTMAVHTGGGEAALAELEILEEEGVAPSAWIWVHAQTEKDAEVHTRVAEAGGWLSFDGIGPTSIGQHADFVAEMKLRGFLGRVMISHDAGWYRPGEPNGGVFRPFDTLFTEFLPVLREAGLDEAEIRQVTVENPARAFTVGVRKA